MVLSLQDVLKVFMEVVVPSCVSVTTMYGVVGMMAFASANRATWEHTALKVSHGCF